MQRRIPVGFFSAQVGDHHAELRNGLTNRSETLWRCVDRVGEPAIHPGVEENEHAFCCCRFIQGIHAGIVNKEILIIRVKLEAPKALSPQVRRLPGTEGIVGMQGRQRFDAGLPNGC